MPNGVRECNAVVLMKMAFIGSVGIDIIEGVVLLKNVCHLGWALWFQMSKLGTVLFSLHAARGYECRSLCYISSNTLLVQAHVFLP